MDEDAKHLWIMKNIYLIVVGILLIGIVSASFEYDNPTLPHLEKIEEYINKKGDSATGTFDFNGGWMNNGLSIIGGNIFAQVGYFYNITSLNVTRQDLTILDDLIVNGKISLEFGDLVSEQNPDGGDAIRMKATVSDVDVVIGHSTGYFNVWNAADNNAVFYVDDRGDTDIAGDLIVDTDTLFVDAGNDRVDVRGGTPTIQWGVTGSTVRGALGYTGGNPAIYGLAGYPLLFGAGNTLELMRLTTAGRLGIGTDSPDEKLHVSGATAGDGAHIGNVFTGVWNVSDGWAVWSHNNFKAALGDYGLIQSNAGATLLNAKAGQYVGLRINNEPVLHIDLNKNVGIGTALPTAQLHLEKVGVNSVIKLDRTDAAVAGRIELIAGNSQNSIISYGATKHFGIATNGTEKMRVEAGGNVGIGTTNPDTKLEVSGGNIKISNVQPVLFFEDTTGGQDSFSINTFAGGIRFFNSDDTRTDLHIDGDGNVGIGTATPQQTLNVVGDLNVTGTIINDAIYCESSELNDQGFAVAGVRYRLNISNVDEGNGISMSTGNNGTNITIDTSGVYHLVAQPQVKAGAGGAGDFHMWMEKFNLTAWNDIPDSNIELKLSSLEEDVIVLATTLKLNQGEKLRLVASVSDIKILLHAQSPAGEPVIPSIIFTMYRIGN